jgi:predicted alpha/beta hydrolase family esterase
MKETKAHPNKKQVVFIRGAGGKEAYDEDAKLVASLQEELGANYNVRYPHMLDDGDDAPDSEWLKQIGKEIAAIKNEVILVAHSVGASNLLKYFAENKVNHQIAGIFLIAAPFWGGDEGWQYEGFTMPEDFPDHLPKNVAIFIYHNRDDEVVPFAHLALYVAKLPQAIVREGAHGGHQFSNNLTQVALDIKNLKRLS